LIALLHSFVGLAAVLVGWNGALDSHDVPADFISIHHGEVFIGVFIGAVTFTGSIVAFLKLSARISSSPLMLPGKNVLNVGALLGFVGLTVWYIVTPDIWLLVAVTVLALLLGWHLVASIGGGDMPVVVSMLNSYSGWAAAAAGFLLNNDLLIVTGALVGSSGAYLSYIMCKAMNRSFISVIAGGFGIPKPAAAGEEEVDDGVRQPLFCKLRPSGFNMQYHSSAVPTAAPMSSAIDGAVCDMFVQTAARVKLKILELTTAILKLNNNWRRDWYSACIQMLLITVQTHAKFCNN
jgi:NAD/NADP transhydrogenase beta subunit